MNNLKLILLSSLLFVPALLHSQNKHPKQFKHLARSMKAEWYASDEALRVADSVMAYQYPCGGWAKNHDWHAEENEQKMHERQKIRQQIAHAERAAQQDTPIVGATIDNGATTHELLFLAKVYAACSKATVTADSPAGITSRRCREAYLRGLEYLLEAQYDNGGWPQYYPFKPLDNEGHPFYSNHITFNDDAIYNVMLMLREVYEQRQPHGSMHLEPELTARVRQAFDRGIECILDCQIRKDGKLTVWCQQHDERTLAPAPARAYELASFTGSHETASLLSLLMSLEKPSQRVLDAVRGAVEWLEAHALKDVELQMFTNSEGKPDRRLVHHFGHQTWARYYDLQTEEPYVCDRDGIPQPSLEYIGYERRNGYGWYGDSPQKIIDRYPGWLQSLGINP
jgi:pectinesterase